MRDEPLLSIGTSTAGPYGNAIRVAPPLVITQEECDFAVDTLDKVMVEVEASISLQV